MFRNVRFALKGSTSQRNYFLGILNGAFTRLGMNLTHASMVLSVFVRTLGGSNTLVGLLPAIRFGGWFLPQFLAASWIQPRPRKVPIVVGLELVRVLIYGVLGALTCTLGLSHPRLLLGCFFGLFSISRLTAGSGALARLDAIGKVVVPSRRASFFAQRNFWGGTIVFGAGFLVRYLLEPAHSQTFLVDFALLFGLSSASFLVAVLTFARVEENPDPEEHPHHSLRAQLLRAPELIRRNSDFGQYLLVRVLLTMTRISEPFYTVFALEILDAPASIVGFYLSAMTLAAVLSNLLWQRVGQARGTHILVKAAGLLSALTPLLAATLPWLMKAAGFTVERYGLLPAYLFTGVFLFAGSAESGRAIGFTALLLDIAPDEERASYVGLANTVLGFVSLLPILSGAIIDRLGFAPVFFAATFLLLLGYLVTLRWKPSQVYQ